MMPLTHSYKKVFALSNVWNRQLWAANRETHFFHDLPKKMHDTSIYR